MLADCHVKELKTNEDLKSLFITKLHHLTTMMSSKYNLVLFQLLWLKSPVHTLQLNLECQLNSLNGLLHEKGKVRFCRRDVDESLHGDGFSNIHSWRSRSELENNSCEILKIFNLGKKKGRLFLMWKNIGVRSKIILYFFIIVTAAGGGGTSMVNLVREKKETVWWFLLLQNICGERNFLI